MRYCTQCGTGAETGQMFCTRCGSQLGPPAERSAPETQSLVTPPPAGADPPPGDSRPPVTDWIQPPGHRWGGRTGAVVAIVAIVLVAGGGAAAWKLLGHQPAHHGGSTVTAGSGRRQPAGISPAANSVTPAATPSATPSRTATPTPSASGTQAGQGTVAIAAAVSQQAAAPQVAAFLQAYFQAVNTRDYGRYSSLFVPRLRPTLGAFESGYRSTHDSGAVLTGMSPTAVGLAAAVSFTSHQHPVDSPTGTSCDSWRITLYLSPRGSTYLIVHPPAGYHARYQAC